MKERKMFDYDNIPKKPVRWETTWWSKGNSFTGRHTGRKHKPGEIWQDEDGDYHTITLNRLGEGACMDGPDAIEEYLQKQGK